MLTAVALMQEDDTPIFRTKETWWIGTFLIARIRTNGRRWRIEGMEGTRTFDSYEELTMRCPKQVLVNIHKES